MATQGRPRQAGAPSVPHGRKAGGVGDGWLGGGGEAGLRMVVVRPPHATAMPFASSPPSTTSFASHDHAAALSTKDRRLLTRPPHTPTHRFQF